MIKPSTRNWIEDILEGLDMVEWDRFVTAEDPDAGRYVEVYGWIDRADDGYKDFVLVRFFPDTSDNLVAFTTSSDRYSAEISSRIFGDRDQDDHNQCRRVEHTFEIDNAIELDLNATISEFAGGQR